MTALQHSQLQHIQASAHRSIRHVHSPLFHSASESSEMEGGCPAVTKHGAKPILSTKRWLKKQHLTLTVKPTWYHTKHPPNDLQTANSMGCLPLSPAGAEFVLLNSDAGKGPQF